VPVRACADALRALGVPVELITVRSSAGLDEVLARFDDPARLDGLTWPGPVGLGPALVVATAGDGALRAVLRRMVRRYAPPPSRRPADLDPARTVPDLPPIGILPLDPARHPGVLDLAAQLGLPRDPAEVAMAVRDGQPIRLDLLRTDAGTVAAHGVLLGGTDPGGAAAPFDVRVDVDDLVLAKAGEPVLAVAVANAGGYATVDGLALVPAANPADGRLDVAVAVAVRAGSGRRGRRGLARTGPVEIQVRRAAGRAVSIRPASEVPCLHDGVNEPVAHQQTWWVEPAAWAVYRPKVPTG
jgi:diacylglycerol kinase family enzyme